MAPRCGAGRPKANALPGAAPFRGTGTLSRSIAALRRWTASTRHWVFRRSANAISSEPMSNGFWVPTLRPGDLRGGDRQLSGHHQEPGGARQVAIRLGRGAPTLLSVVRRKRPTAAFLIPPTRDSPDLERRSNSLRKAQALECAPQHPARGTRLLGLHRETILSDRLRPPTSAPIPQERRICFRLNLKTL